ncbi:hypothetical protein Cni_G18556 [Canna indica]|uniref:Uncharacterized protein n=1 Tax=Canna indica TaxID=4628 RepID=A0AAQ3KMG6_9LILI|nr:hypothetical protein Cni_G18556 [Canna indica]
MSALSSSPRKTEQGECICGFDELIGLLDTCSSFLKQINEEKEKALLYEHRRYPYTGDPEAIEEFIRN